MAQAWEGEKAAGDGKVSYKICYDRESRKKCCVRPKDGRRDDEAGGMGGGEVEMTM